MVITAPKPPPTQPIAPEADATGAPPLVLRLSPVIQFTEEQFADFCELNSDLRIERTATGELEIMSPTKGYTGSKELKAATQLEIWASRHRGGMAFGPTAGFTLPNRAMRSPDASWVSLSRLSQLTPEDENRFLPVSPEFVVEVRSLTDRLTILQAKMREYIANGVQLGWLIDTLTRRVHIYRPNQEVEILQDPQTISADPTLPGFTLDLTEIWDPWHNLRTQNQE